MRIFAASLAALIVGAIGIFRADFWMFVLGPALTYVAVMLALNVISAAQEKGALPQEGRRSPMSVEPVSAPTIASPQEPTVPEARPHLKLPPKVLFVDVETTGLHSRDRIVSYAGILLTSAGLADHRFDISYSHLICDPGVKSHPEAEKVHGYSDWLLRHQEPFSEQAEVIFRQFSDADLVVAHNAEFDLKFIDRCMGDEGYPPNRKPVFCTMTEYRNRGYGGRANLDSIAQRIGLRRSGENHGALEDAWLAMMIYFALEGLPYQFPFSALGDPTPRNLLPAPPLPDGPLPRRKRRKVTSKPLGR